ncbi:3-isopropylmalate dehydratase large subunit [Neolewinella agarilytica]|uniref:3-isopropylmalate dehydratase large subunit n=1 Tax=Neolewinella agarilytica TaxID=478744 RepID=A0A1H9ICQ2_9BACT|nr:3-isopropylmalate dehydratase large subunit [Neolewinella agarilytica]SEQ72356.1 3-isopropylmalate dehydratase, large subunit [Neolewinella agarilytica]
MAKTLFDKVWDAHVVTEVEGGNQVLYIDRHLIHEVTSPQAFNGLRKRGIPLLRKDRIVATADHNVPTINQHKPISEPLSAKQVKMLTDNCAEFGVELYGLGHPYQGIVHVIGPELGITRPGITMVCGDSHTSTHGAFGAVAFGIGTSQVEQVMATQCLLLTKPKSMRINVEGDLAPGVTAKDIILYVISQIGTGGGTGYFVEYAGSAIRSLSMEGRMTVCNMSIEMGARGGLIAPDQTTFDYLEGREFSPKGKDWEEAVAYWKTLPSESDATFDAELHFKASDITPMVTYGTNPGMGMGVKEHIPVHSDIHGDAGLAKAMNYMGLEKGQQLDQMPIDYVFIGSCTNSRIEDLRAVVELVGDRKVADTVTAIVVPGSQQVSRQAIAEGLDKKLIAAGFEFREAGCSACLGMNEDKVPAGKYCVSTSNRNFEGRQGQGARTILASPLTAAAAAVTGKVVDVRELI